MTKDNHVWIMHDKWLDISANVMFFPICYLKITSATWSVAYTALQHERAEARENNGLHDITRSCLSLVRVRHCSSTLSSDRIFITTQYSYIFHHIFISYFIYYFRLEGELSLRGYARAQLLIHTRTRLFTETVGKKYE